MEGEIHQHTLTSWSDYDEKHVYILPESVFNNPIKATRCFDSFGTMTKVTIDDTSSTRNRNEIDRPSFKDEAADTQRKHWIKDAKKE